MDEESSNAGERLGPVCGSCGKPVADDTTYCEHCRAAARARMEAMPIMGQPSAFGAGRRGQGRWVVYSMTGMVILLVALASAMVLSIPGDNDFAAQARASVCRANLRSVEAAVQRFYAAEGKAPPAGTIDESHPLVMDHYLDEALRCPGTRRCYQLLPPDRLPACRCPSSLPGHEL